MSQRTEKYTVPARESERVIETTCDLCGSTTEGDDWEKHTYDIDDVTVSYEKGNRYPEGGDKTVQEFDVCPACWATEIVPLFASRGSDPRERSVDW